MARSRDSPAPSPNRQPFHAFLLLDRPFSSSATHAPSRLSPSLPGDIKPPPPNELYPIYVVLAGLIMLAFVGVGMVASRKRRREHGQLWFPEGFKTSESNQKKRREPVGEDSVGLK